ncbi:MAG: hypothetical protein JW834_03090 [Candidatus Diapherotrites archaeon]|nr:hypothetical protein [Candidatus Diapherotrites archaeon]
MPRKGSLAVVVKRTYRRYRDKVKAVLPSSGESELRKGFVNGLEGVGAEPHPLQSVLQYLKPKQRPKYALLYDRLAAPFKHVLKRIYRLPEGLEKSVPELKDLPPSLIPHFAASAVSAVSPAYNLPGEGWDYNDSTRTVSKKFGKHTISIKGAGVPKWAKQLHPVTWREDVDITGGLEERSLWGSALIWLSR